MLGGIENIPLTISLSNNSKKTVRNKYPEKVENLEQDQLLKDLWAAKCNSAIFRNVQPYCKKMAEKKGNFPKTYEKLYYENNVKKELHELVNIGNFSFMHWLTA